MILPVLQLHILNNSEAKIKDKIAQGPIVVDLFPSMILAKLSHSIVYLRFE